MRSDRPLKAGPPAAGEKESVTEERDGRVYKVTRLPAVEPPKGRSKRTRYHLIDVGKQGDVHRRRKRRKRRKR